jgi:hypothetical protein
MVKHLDWASSRSLEDTARRRSAVARNVTVVEPPLIVNDFLKPGRLKNPSSKPFGVRRAIYAIQRSYDRNDRSPIAGTADYEAA